MSTTQTADELNMTVKLDLKKIDYVTDWDNDPRQLIEQIASPHDDIDAAMEMVEGWDRWPQPVMVLIGRTAGGKRVTLINTEIEPYFYIPVEEYDSDIEADSKVMSIDHGFTNPDGDNMVKITTRVPGDVPKLRDEYSHHEADILFPNRFLIDSGITDGMEIPIEHATEHPTQITLDEITPCSYSKESRVCFCDIEVDDSNGFPEQSVAKEEITSIAVYDNYTEQYDLFLYHPETPEVDHPDADVWVYGNEYDMIYHFVDYVLDKRFDIITGWNFDDFDMRYIVNRLDFLSELDNDFELNSNDISILGSAFDEGYFGSKVKGLAVFDMLMAYKESKFSELDSFSLEDVAQEELGEGKITDNRDLYKIWRNDTQKFVDYNIRDVELVVRLEEEQGIIKFFEEMASYVGGRLTECIKAHKAVDIKILRAVYDKWVVPSGSQAEGMDFEGGQVFDPITGIKQNVIVLDLKSLYPMCMKTLNAGINTKDPEGDIVAPDGTRFSSEETALVVDIIDELLEERQKYKDKRSQYDPGTTQYKVFDRKQGAVKVVMNTLYGVMGWDKFRLADVDVGSAVTSTGRAVIKFTEKVVEELGYSVIYGDTDSVMIELGPDVTREEALRIGHKLEEKLNDSYDDFAKEKLNTDTHYFQMEFEKLYERYFQAGAKKRYAGNIVWKEGEEVDKTDIVGFEFKRSDYAKVPKTLQEEVLSVLVRGGGLEDIHAIVDDTIDKIKDSKYNIEDLGMPSSVSSNFDSYDNPTQAVKGSMYANENLGDTIRPGDKPKKYFIKSIGGGIDPDSDMEVPPSDGDGNYYICVSDVSKIPEDWEVDWDVFIDKQIKKPMQRILAGTDWTWNEVLTNQRQPRLDEYTFEDNSNDGTEAISVEDSMTEERKKSYSSKSSKSQEEENPDPLGDIMEEIEDIDNEKEVVTASFSKPEGDEYELDDYL